MRTHRSFFVLSAIVAAFACNKKPTSEPAPGSAAPVAQAADAAAAAAAPAWSATSHPIELACGDGPLTLTPPQPAASPAAARTFKHGDAFSQCHDQASIAAACDCLAKSVATWGKKLLLAGPATCTPQPNARADGAVVLLQDESPDTATRAGGSALVLLAKRGATWSAISVVESSADIDLTQTPKLTGSLKLVAFDEHPIAGGLLYSIETRTETAQSDMGEHDLDGTASATLCSVPADAHPDAFCYVPVALGSWSYTWTPKEGSCEIKKLATFAATYDATGATLRLDHGSDADTVAGHYGF
ncbi:MAG TPA: hypothetical protein VH143_33860 [Kofleriaceae bacterium]|jgi:hypothetical protein|nr:hypothetical protein [Kofleriaceae bacterium]